MRIELRRGTNFRVWEQEWEATADFVNVEDGQRVLWLCSYGKTEAEAVALMDERLSALSAAIQAWRLK